MMVLWSLDHFPESKPLYRFMEESHLEYYLKKDIADLEKGQKNPIKMIMDFLYKE